MPVEKIRGEKRRIQTTIIICDESGDLKVGKVNVMSKLTIIGFVAWLCGGLILGFQAISSLMGAEDEMVWKSLTLVDVVGKNYFEWIKTLPWVILQQTVTYVVNMPLYLLLFCVGILCFLVNAFKPKI
jgi:hypothetical protein